MVHLYRLPRIEQQEWLKLGYWKRKRAQLEWQFRRALRVSGLSWAAYHRKYSSRTAEIRSGWMCSQKGDFVDARKAGEDLRTRYGLNGGSVWCGFFYDDDPPARYQRSVFKGEPLPLPG